MAFKIAGSMAFKKLVRAESGIARTIMKVEVVVPEEYMAGVRRL